MKMVVINYSETSVQIWTRESYIPEDGNIQTCANLAGFVAEILPKYK
jgi:hypothetical protein